MPNFNWAAQAGRFESPEMLVVQQGACIVVEFDEYDDRCVMGLYRATRTFRLHNHSMSLRAGDQWRDGRKAAHAILQTMIDEGLLEKVDDAFELSISTAPRRLVDLSPLK